MLDIIDATNTTDCVLPESPAVTESQTEQELGEEIASLWSAHTGAKNTAKATRDGLRDIRVKLGEQLCRMKEVLACPGRDGQWSGFLRERRIPRATADRLVTRHLRSVNPDANRLSEPVSKPTEEEVQRLFNSILPRLRRFLRTPNSVYSFVSMLTSHYECSEVTDRGVLILKPAIPTIATTLSDVAATAEIEPGSAPSYDLDQQSVFN
jgi:hypothetical protein